MHNFIKDYLALTNSSNFIQFYKDLAFKLDVILDKGQGEVKTVQDWVNLLNNENLNSKFGQINFNTIFIHSFNRSQHGSHPSGIEFDSLLSPKYSSSKISKKEMGDIIFITSFYDKQNKILEKMTINQVKKTKDTAWNIDQEQLYFLSRFPRFKGVVGSIIPQKNYYLQDHSKALGSFGLMQNNNFTFLGANRLLTVIGNKSSVKLNDFSLMNNFTPQPNFSLCLDDDFCYHLYKKFHRTIPYQYISSLNKLFNIEFSNLYSNSTFDFIENYLKGYIGELIACDEYKNISTNTEANRFLNDILSNLSQDINNQVFLNNYGYAGRNNDNNPINSFDFDEESGIAIIQVKITLEGN